MFPTRSSAGAPASRRPTCGPSEPIFLTYQDPYERFRIGDGAGSWNADPAKRKLLPGNQFPVEAYENYMRQSVPRWLSTDDAIIKAYVALVDKVCPCVLLVHSQGGAFGFKVAEQRPDKVKAIVAIESASAGVVANAPKLKDVPVLMVFGDYVDQHPRWSTFKKIDMEYGNAIKAAGGKVDWINLPDIGIKGNSHMLMQDKNTRPDRRGDPEVAGRQSSSTESGGSDMKQHIGRNPMRMVLTLMAALAASPRLRKQGADRAARHRLVPYRRPAYRDYRPAGQGGRVHARRRAGQGRPERRLPGRADVRAVLPGSRTARESCRC